MYCQEINDGVVVTEQDETDFKQNDLDGPPLQPMRICWENLRGAWNSELADLFTHHFLRKYPDYAHSEKSVEDVSKHFIDRVVNLHRYIKAAKFSSSEPKMRKYAQGYNLMVLKNNRKNERRETVCHV